MRKEPEMETERIPQFLHSLEKEELPVFAGMRAYAEQNDVPIVRRETESFLRTVTAAKRPDRVLEIGTAIGYSALVLSEYSGSVVTIENYEVRIPIAKENIRKAGKEDMIRLIEGDAGKVLKEMTAEKETFDLIFLDAAKGQYSVWLEDIISLLEPNGLLVADNVLQDGTVTESRFTVDRRDRTTHERMREFLYRIKHDSRLESSVIPIGDGVSLSVKL